jgi:hypothetical protein
MGNGECVIGAKHGAEIEELQRACGDLKRENRDEHDDLWQAVNALRNRLPLWATVLISLLASTVTGLLVAIVKLRG